MTTFLRLALTSLIALLVAAPAAMAANLSASGNTITYTADATEANTLTVTRDADSVDFADAAGIVIAVAVVVLGGVGPFFGSIAFVLEERRRRKLQFTGTAGAPETGSAR